MELEKLDASSAHELTQAARRIAESEKEQAQKSMLQHWLGKIADVAKNGGDRLLVHLSQDVYESLQRLGIDRELRQRGFGVEIGVHDEAVKSGPGYGMVVGNEDRYTICINWEPHPQQS